MAAALTLLLIGSLLQGAQNKVFQAFLPQTIEVLTGSCVTIPCSFEIEDKRESYLDDTCRAIWKKNNTLAFDSKDPRPPLNNGELTGNLRKKDCTTNLNNIQPAGNYTYFFRLECNNALKWSFDKQTTLLSVKDVPPRPTLTPSALKVEEGASVSLRCSAPAPCLSHPPNVTWTKGLGDIVETLQENEDRTKVLTSVVTFTASHKHHGEKISCKASYHKQDGSAESAVSLTADVSCLDGGSCDKVLLSAVAGVSLGVNLLFSVCIVFLWKSRRNVKPEEVDQTYMSLDPRDKSPEYDVIAQTSR